MVGQDRRRVLCTAARRTDRHHGAWRDLADAVGELPKGEVDRTGDRPGCKLVGLSHVDELERRIIVEQSEQRPCIDSPDGASTCTHDMAR